MSTSFGSSNLFGVGTENALPTANAASYAPRQLGLRQRRAGAAAATASNDNANGGAWGNENANPNNAASRGDGGSAYGRWGSLGKVRAPPRASLATAGGKSTFSALRSATAQQQQQRPAEGNMPNIQRNQGPIALSNEKETADLSLWVVGFGYRNEAGFRALYQRLQSCGTITARIGGLSCFGEDKSDAAADDGSNWVAVQYESVLRAHKALCLDGNFVNVGGGGTMVVGVMPLEKSDAAAKLGFSVSHASTRDNSVKLSGMHGSNRKYRELTDSDILLNEDEWDDDSQSRLDSLCGKVLGWFFMWET